MPIWIQRPVSWRRLLPNLIADQERIWSFPARLTQGQNWIPTAAILGTTAGLIALDPTEASYFRRSTSTYQGFNNIFTGNATIVGTIVSPVSLYTIGLIRRDSKMQQTALLAGEADGNDTYIEVHSGAGGTESCDWARMLERIANAAEIPATVLAFELDRLRAWRKNSADTSNA